MSDVFKDAWQGWAAGPDDQGLEGGANEGQSAGCRRIADPALIFAPACVALPVPAFARPVRLDHLGHGLVAFGFQAPTAHKMPIEFFVVGGWCRRRRLFEGRPVARFEKLFGFGKVRALRIGPHSEEFALDGAAMLAVD